MGFITVSGETGCRTEELAGAAAHRLRFHLITESRIESLLSDEFGGPVPDKAWTAAVTSIAARLGAEHDLVIAAPGSENVLSNIAGVLRLYLLARPAHRSGNLMLDLHTDRAGATGALRKLEGEQRERRKSRFGRSTPDLHAFDLLLNAEQYDAESFATVVESAFQARGLAAYGRLSTGAEAHIQFQARLQLARFGIAPAGHAALARKIFSHPSEQLFASLLDFYRIPWEYEPRSFPLQWDKNGKVTEAFTPDFYLREFDLYVEVTTMKQALVTRKNRKIKRLKAIYPHINIQVFYQRDFQDLVFKYGLEGREVTSDGQ